MSSIQEILNELRDSVAVKGCLLMMKDGIIVAHALEGGLEPDMVSGLTSFLTSTVNRVLGDGGMGGFTSFNIQSTHGKVLVTDMGQSYLVILTNQFGQLELSMPEVQDASRQLRRVSRISL